MNNLHQIDNASSIAGLLGTCCAAFIVCIEGLPGQEEAVQT